MQLYGQSQPGVASVSQKASFSWRLQGLAGFGLLLTWTPPGLESPFVAGQAWPERQFQDGGSGNFIPLWNRRQATIRSCTVLSGGPGASSWRVAGSGAGPRGPDGHAMWLPERMHCCAPTRQPGSVGPGASAGVAVPTLSRPLPGPPSVGPVSGSAPESDFPFSVRESCVPPCAMAANVGVV
jgi:hypothetical protein